LNELLGDKNQKSIEAILANVERVSGDLSQTTPEMRATLIDARAAIARTGKAAEDIGALAGNASTFINDEGKPLISDLKKSISAADKSMKALEEVLAEAKPGMTTFSQRTIPEVGALVRDLRSMSESLSSVAEKLDQRGAGALISSPALPDYEPKK
jgi:phospholipid/cholesterol/gamma-HCH transport system substrate-binding protein